MQTKSLQAIYYFFKFFINIHNEHDCSVLIYIVYLITLRRAHLEIVRVDEGSLERDPEQGSEPVARYHQAGDQSPLPAIPNTV